MKDFMMDTLSERSLSGSPLDKSFVGRMIAEHLEKKADHGRSLWAILVFHLWWEKYT